MRLLLLMFILTFVHTIVSQVAIEGNYRGTNLYIQNPWHQNDEFCVDSVIVNGTKYCDASKFSAFQIKLDSLGFIVNDRLEINIYHKKGCKPLVLNQASHYRRVDLNITNFNIVNDTVYWNATKEVVGYFDVQVYRWNRWVTLDSVEKQFEEVTFKYALINDLHCGENKFRIRSVNILNENIYSEVLSYNSDLAEVTYTIDNKSNQLVFSRITRFEFFNQYGQKVLEGKSNSVNLNHLPNKTYYLNLDNRNVDLKLKH